MIFGMESEVLEFKKTTGELNVALEDIVAILNKHQGGELYFGIKPDGTVVGQMVSTSSLRDVSQAIGTRIKPQIIPTVEMVKIDNKECIRVVFEGHNVPYFADSKAYIRVADESRQLAPEALEEFFKKKQGLVSIWDTSISDSALTEMNTNFVRSYMKKANEAGRLSFKFSDLRGTLNKLHLLEKDAPRNAAVVMFGKKPNLEIQMAVFATKERLTFLDIDRQSGTIDQLVDAAEWYFRRNTRWRVVLEGNMKREEIPEVPIEALREALFNSYAHKDYFVPQINELVIFSDRIEVYNPGAFPEGYSPEDFIMRDEQPIHRNPLLAQIMYYSKDIEGFGTGLKKIADECNAAGVRYEFKKKKQGFSVVFFRRELPVEPNEVVGADIEESESGEDAFLVSNVTNVTKDVTNVIKDVTDANDGQLNGFSYRQKEILGALTDDPKKTVTTLAEEMGVAKRTVLRDIESLKASGNLAREGSVRAGHWIVILPVS
ncbi:MAG: putative DNA binding domain-containing protein [Coriobacteriia bacterium]|nr:putative DNA binding domain-containing protein [Coriobacteriia bacterium]